MQNNWNFTPTALSTGRNNYMESINSEILIDTILENQNLIKELTEKSVRLREVTPDKSLLNVNKIEFSEITMDSIMELQLYLNEIHSRSCDFSIGGIMMWVDYFQYKMGIVDDTLIIRGYDKTKNIMLYYCSEDTCRDGRIREMIEKDCNETGLRGVTVTPEGIDKDDYDALKEEERCGYEEAWKEYLYDIEKFLHFSGKKMEKKRNHLNYFEKHYPGYEIVELTEASAEELIEFTHRYELNHEDSELFNYESTQTIKVLEKFSSYPFEGLYLRHEGKVIGYTFGERSGDTFFVHVEKGDMDYQGVYQALASLLARKINEKYPEVKYLNREEDMGNESLRQSKESYHPSHYERKYVCEV